jgi:DNA-binding XRE family transcriptional regulator
MGEVIDFKTGTAAQKPKPVLRMVERRAEGSVYLEAWRRHLGLTQGDLALRLNRDKAWVGKVENGGRAPRVSDIVELCKVMGIEFEDIFRHPTQAA